MKKPLIIFFIVILYNNVFSQQIIDSSYINYFENTREIPFLHLNKTTFLKGEEIWYKAYVQEQNTQKLHPTTSNLYVSIFNKDGSIKDQQLVHIKEGTGYGNILIDSTFTNDSYYLKASTKWMKNFEEDNAFYQKIKIISSDKKKHSIIKKEENAFDYKLFPEGGHLIANAVNNIGILIKDKNNKGVQVEKGVIRDEHNNIIRNFTTNELGMNSVRLFIKDNQTYKFSVILSNGKELHTHTPKPINQGITLNILNKNTDQVAINIISNDNTVNKLKGKTYSIMVHNTRKFRNFTFKFSEKKNRYTLILDKNQLFSGVNIITVFNEDNIPLTERLTYIHSNELFHQLDIKYKVQNDSIKFTLNNSSKEFLHASASFLPSKTKAYKPKNNIITSFLLKPYIKGNIDNYNDLFNIEKDNKLRKLDLLLLTQGWSKYKWNTIFKVSPKKMLYPFENGIDLAAKFNKSLSKKESILVYSKENNLVTTIYKNQNPWVLKNSFLKKNSTITFGINKEDRLTKISPALSFSSSSLTDKLNQPEKHDNLFINEFETSNFKPLKKEFETLNEVEVKANKKDASTNDNLASGYRKIDLKNSITHSGMKVLEFIITKTPPLRPISQIELNGRDVMRELWSIQNMYLDEVKSIHYGTDIRALRRPTYAFFIFTYSDAELRDQKSTMAEVKIPVGFATEKEYYSPKYPSHTNETYKEFGALSWNPNIKIFPKNKQNIIIPSRTQKNVLIYIEGITESDRKSVV